MSEREKLIKQIDKEIARLENEIEGLVSEKLELEAEETEQ